MQKDNYIKPDSKELEQWILDRITVDSYNVYAITLNVIRNKRRYNRFYDITTSHSVFDLFYKFLCGEIVNRHYDRPSKSHLLPKALIWVDYSGSRHGKLHLQTMPHLHGVLLIHPDTHDHFKQQMISNFSEVTSHLHTNVDIDIKPIYTAGRWVNYSKKLTCYQEMIDRSPSDLFQAYPKAISEKASRVSPYRVNDVYLS